jgi:hypothetical protein
MVEDDLWRERADGGRHDPASPVGDMDFPIAST